LSKENLIGGLAANVKAKVWMADLSLQINTMLTGMAGALVDCGEQYIPFVLRGRLHLFNEEEHLEALAHLSNGPGVTCAALAAGVFSGSV